MEPREWESKGPKTSSPSTASRASHQARRKRAIGQRQSELSSTSIMSIISNKTTPNEVFFYLTHPKLVPSTPHADRTATPHTTSRYIHTPTYPNFDPPSALRRPIFCSSKASRVRYTTHGTHHETSKLATSNTNVPRPIPRTPIPVKAFQRMGFAAL